MSLEIKKPEMIVPRIKSNLYPTPRFFNKASNVSATMEALKKVAILDQRKRVVGSGSRKSSKKDS